jgi:TRAP-type mannitol/chloroaromatic compound transport system substrate-binding protein
MRRRDFIKRAGLGVAGGAIAAPALAQTQPQIRWRMASSFPKSLEIKSVNDLKGLKMRVAGLAGQILAKLGVVPQQIGGGDIYPALEKGTIDAAEWVGPYDDEKLGFYKVAKYYYYPGWWEGSAQLSVYVNAKQWASLPKPYQEALEVACAEANVNMMARYDAKNTEALRRLVGAGAQLRAFPRPVMEACYNVAQDLYAEFSAKSAEFKKIYTSWNQFRDDQYLWFRVAENTFDNFVYSIRKPKK